MKWTRAAALAAVLAGLAQGAAVHAQIRIGVIASSTGPTAVVGIPQKNSVPLLPRSIAGQDVEYIVYDDASDATQTVILFKKLVAEHRIDALIGPTGSPGAVALVPFVAETRTPMLAPVGTTAVVLPMDDKKRWVFKTTQNDDLIAEALIGHMVRSGVKTVGFIGYNDPYGESWLRSFGPMADKAGLKLVATERYLRTDQSVMGQTMRLLAAAPDAVLVAGTGGPAVLPQSTLFERGYKGTVYQTHGAATPEFVRLGGRSVEGTVMAASLMLVIDQVPDSHPARRVATEYMAAYEKLNGLRAATFGANVYDAGLLLARAVPEALRRGRPGTVEFRSALRDAIEAIRDMPGTQGVYNLDAQDHSGFDRRGRVLMQLKDGAWRLLPE